MSRSRIALVAVALVACGKDEPPASPASHAAPTAPTAPTAPAAPPLERAPHAADQAGVASGAPGAAGTPTPAAPAPEPLAPASASPLPTLAPIDGTTVATIPPSILAVGGLASLDALAAAVGGHAPALADIAQAAVARVKETFGLADAAWFAVDRPVRFAVPDPRAWPEGFVLALPIALGHKLAPEAIRDAKPKVEGHWAKLERMGRAFYLDVRGDVLLVTSHADMVKKLGDFPEALAAWTPKQALVVEASVANARVIFANELAEAQAQSKRMGEMLREAGLASAQLEAMESIAGGLFGLVADLDRAGFALDPAGDFPRVEASFGARPGSPLAATFADLAQRRPSLASAIPGDAWLALAYDIAPSDLLETDTIVRALTTSDKPWPKAEAEALAADLARLQPLLSGPAAMWARVSGAFPFGLEVVSAVSDPPAARGLLLAILERVFAQTWGATRQELVASGLPESQLPGLRPADFMRGVAPLARAFGATPSLVVGDATHADALTLDLDWARAGGGRLPGAIASMLSRMIGVRLEAGLAAGAGRTALTFGPEGAARAVALTTEGPHTIADPWIAYAEEGAFAFVTLRPTRLLRALADLPQLASKRAAIVKLPDDPLVLAGRASGARVTLTLTAPVALVSGLLNLR